MQNSDFRGLSNQQIVYLYLINKSALTRYTDIITRRGYLIPADLPGMGRVSIFKEVSEESIQKLKESPLLKQTQDLNDVLEPIALLIKETDLPDYESALSVFEQRIELV